VTVNAGDKCELWVLLSRHITRLDDFACNQVSPCQARMLKVSEARDPCPSLPVLCGRSLLGSMSSVVGNVFSFRKPRSSSR
jgi:hypothetical protein